MVNHRRTKKRCCRWYRCTKSLEFAFDKNDRDVLEPFGYNPIVFERGVGLTIKGNKTAQQGIQSALSSAHVREAMIYIEDGLAEILKNYLFEFNTAQTRLEIKTLADNFMESVKKDRWCIRLQKHHGRN